MRSLEKQKGVGFISIVFILIGLIGMLGIKVAPMYIDNMTINEVVKQVANDQSTRGMSVKDLRKALTKRLLVNGLDSYAEYAKFTKDAGVVYLELSYERRDNLWGNIDVVGVFENTAEVRTGN